MVYSFNDKFMLSVMIPILTAPREVDQVIR